MTLARDPSGAVSPIATVAASALRIGIRDRTVLWLVILFMSMVLLSAYLGWSATHAIDQIYAQVVLALQHEGRPVPPNPVGDMPALSMLRNMTTYVSLLGALVAIVLGWQIVSEDRRSGMFPLIASRPVSRTRYALGKVLALVVAITCMLALAGAVNAASLLLLPGTPLTAGDWVSLANFYAVSALFLTAFGLLAMASTAWSRSEVMGLLVPVTVWLVLTFVFPQLSANINPMAALNPIKAMVAPPAGAFFEFFGPLLAPVSLVATYRDIAATMLGFAPADAASLGVPTGIASLVVANWLLGGTAVLALHELDASRSDTDE